MFVLEATDAVCPKCSKKLWRLAEQAPPLQMQKAWLGSPFIFMICEDDFSLCGYIEQVGVGPVERIPTGG